MIKKSFMSTALLTCAMLILIGTTDKATAAACSAVPGSAALESAAAALQPGEWCEFVSPSLTFDLISDSENPSSDAFDYGGAGIYDAVRRKVRFLGGPHGKGSMRLIEYDEDSDEWRNNEKPSAISEGHGYDHNVVDSATGHHYVRKYLSNRFLYWNGSNWSEIKSDDKCSIGQEPAIGVAWDSKADGLLHVSDGGGVCFWKKATNSWSYMGDPNFTGRFHFAAIHNPKYGSTWLQDYGNQNHAVIEDGKIRSLSSSPPPGIDTLGCCGSGGVITTYEPSSGLFVVVNHRTGTWAEYDITTDEWRTFDNSLPITHNSSYEITSGFHVTIERYAVIMYVVGQGRGNSPKAYLYRHGSSTSGEERTRPEPPVFD